MTRIRFFRLTALLLAMLMIFSLASCKENQMPQDTAAPPVSAVDPTAPFVPVNSYVIVYGADYKNTERIPEAAAYLANAMQAVYGISCTVKDDSYSQKDGLIPAEHEILLGKTNRAQSTEASATLKVNDYTYHIESRNVIVICGGSTAATEAAVKDFCADVLHYTGDADADKPILTPGTTYTYRDEYEYSIADLNGISLDDLTVAARANEMCKSAKIAVTERLGAYTGNPVSEAAFASLTGDEKAVVCIGAGSRTGLTVINFSGYLITSQTDAKGRLTVTLEASSAEYMTQALEAFFNALATESEAERISFSYTEPQLIHFADMDDWRQSSVNAQTLADGLVYTDYLYHDQHNKPYRVYVLEIDPAKYSFHMGSAQDGYGYTVDKEDRQNVKEHMQAAVANGLDVVAGVNADFFDIHGDYHPAGLAVKNGQQISPANGRPYVAFSADGTARIEQEWSEKDLANTHTAVGGSVILLENGLPVKGLVEDTAAHPRTVVGIREDGTVLLMVIDGRQEQISNGATLYRCALLMRSMGAVSAINLDGGGSSTMITRDGETYTTKNSPSDGSLRDVYNSLLVVKKG